MQLKKQIKLEELLKDKWTPIIIFGEDRVFMGRDGYKIMYNEKKQEIETGYDTRLNPDVVVLK